MKENKIYEMKVNRDQFGQLLDDYSDSGYVNSSYGEIIIDLGLVDDRKEFAELVGLPLEELPTSGFMTYGIPCRLKWQRVHTFGKAENDLRGKGSRPSQGGKA